MEDLDIHAIKTGMLFDADVTRVVAKTLRSLSGTLPPLVCDPVCVSTSGHTLLHPDAVEVMIQDLFPLASLITPNKSEAELLLSHKRLPIQINTREDMLTAAPSLLELGPRAVLLKGRHITTTFGDVDRISRIYPDVHVLRDGLLEDNMEIFK